MLSRVKLMLRALFHKSELEKDLQEELLYHLRKDIERNIALGMGPEEARMAALRAFGGLEQLKEQCRDARGVRLIEEFRQDLRYAGRMLIKTPGFTAVAVTALALGIGANTAIFSVVNAIVLNPLPFKDSSRLVSISELTPAPERSPMTVSPLLFIDWRNGNVPFDNIAAFTEWLYTLTGSGEPEQLECQFVSSELFPLLEVTPALGSAFLPDEEKAGHGNVVMISQSLWRRRFGSSPDIIGRSLTLNDNSYSVVGVMPAGFKFLDRVDLWMPLTFTADELGSRQYHSLSVVGRLKRGVSLQQAQQQMSDMEPQGIDGLQWGAQVERLSRLIGKDVRTTLLVLLGAVSFVLLIACANVANLLLARAAGRQKEIAVRAALGASRLRLIRQFLVESFVLSTLGGTLALLLGGWAVNWIAGMNGASVPRAADIRIDGAVLAFTILTSLATGTIFGVLPAIQSSSPNLSDSLKEGAAVSARGFRLLGRHYRTRSLLVIWEIALALVLLVGAGLMIKSFMSLQRVDKGFDPRNVLTITMPIPASRYRDVRQAEAYVQQLIQSVRSTPGVRYVSISSSVPMTRTGGMRSITIEGRREQVRRGFAPPLPGQPPAPGDSPWVINSYIGPDYFRAMGLSLRKGRPFDEGDSHGAPCVAIVSEEMARAFWPEQDPIGKRVRFGNESSPWFSVIGIAADLKQFNLETIAMPSIYLPYPQARDSNPGPINPLTGPAVIVLRADSDPATLGPSVRVKIWDVDRDQPIAQIETMDELLSSVTAPRRLNTVLMMTFSVMALMLAALGVYGVMAYSVARRTHEIGVRMAVGAGYGDIVRLVLGQAVMLTSLGLGFGLAGALALSRFAASMLFNVSTTDTATFVFVPTLLACVALMASFIPASRATRVDPTVALRSEQNIDKDPVIAGSWLSASMYFLHSRK